MSTRPLGLRWESAIGWEYKVFCGHQGVLYCTERNFLISSLRWLVNYEKGSAYEDYQGFTAHSIWDFAAKNRTIYIIIQSSNHHATECYRPWVGHNLQQSWHTTTQLCSKIIRQYSFAMKKLKIENTSEKLWQVGESITNTYLTLLTSMKFHAQIGSRAL